MSRVVRSLLGILSLGLFLSASALAQEKVADPGAKVILEEAYVQELKETWGYFMSRKMLLERVALKFSDMKKVSILVWAEFKKKEIGVALAEVEALLAESQGKKWDDYQFMVLGQMRAKIAEKELSEETAQEIVRGVKGLTSARIPPEILMVLMSAHPDFVADPMAEIEQGFQRQISSEGMKKAAGVVLEMRCPASWVALEGGTPQMVWRLKSKAGYGNVMSNFTAMELSDSFPEKEARASLKMPALKKMAPGSGTLIAAKELTLGGEPAGMLLYDIVNPVKPEEKIPYRIVQVSTIVQGVLVQLQFGMSADKDAELSLNEVTRRNMPLIQFMTESVKFAK